MTVSLRAGSVRTAATTGLASDLAILVIACDQVDVVDKAVRLHDSIVLAPEASFLHPCGAAASVNVRMCRRASACRAVLDPGNACLRIDVESLVFTDLLDQ
jgi:hypothetical protein